MHVVDITQYARIADAKAMHSPCAILIFCLLRSSKESLVT